MSDKKKDKKKGAKSRDGDEVDELRVELLNAQFDLRKQDFSLKILLTGIDRRAVEETYDLLHEWLDARYIDADPCPDRTDEERERPFMWRYARMIPMDGRIGVQLDAWAKELVFERIVGTLDDAWFDLRLREVATFTRSLTDDGNVVLRLFFDLTKEQLEQRLRDAEEDPLKSWRVTDAERRYVAGYDDVRPLFDHAIERTGAADAPWIRFENLERDARDLAVGRAVRDAILGGIERRKVPQPPPAVRLPAPATSVLSEADLTSKLRKPEYKERLAELQLRLAKLASAAAQEGRSSLLVFEGWDAAGKGGAIRRLTGAMDARDYKVIPIAAPTEEERRHHYLWRFWRHYPRPGQMAIFDRSWYGRVLVERVEGFATEAEWSRAYEEIRDFEEMLMETGAPLAKFWLHIDADEQLQRFEDRQDTPYKKHKLTDEDYRNRKKWDDYVAAVDEMVERTSTRAAPWHIVPANDKRFARVRVLEIVCDLLENALDS
ncbi:MAG: polyphosphate:AMP phosphotransferase [Planctomycetota bacterium]